VSAAPWTLPSFSTIFTSLYPSQHGANLPQHRIRPSIPTLATILKERGYATGALINSVVLEKDYGLDAGFDYYDVVRLDGRRADQTTTEALEWIDSNKGGPFMLFLHYFDIHDPYSPPAPYDTLFDPGYDGVIGKTFKRKRIGVFRAGGFSRLKYLTPADWRHIKALYDGEIAFTDEAVGALLEGLERMNLRESTLIVLLADHGEEFYEHGGLGHGHTLHGEVIRVPLIFSLPGMLPAGGRRDTQVRLVDIMPTVLDFLGFERAPHFEGVSVKPLILGKGEPAGSGDDLLPSTAAFSEALYYGTEQKAISTQPWKVIYDMRSDSSALFNLADDPGELNDLAGNRDEVLAGLDDMLVNTVLNVSGTWYVRLSGEGNIHDFDLNFDAAAGEGEGGAIMMYRFLDDQGMPVEAPAGARRRLQQSMLTVRDIKTSGPLTLALVVEPDDAPLEFDLHIDGEAATGRTYLGTSLTEPPEIPFVAGPETASRGRMLRLAAGIEGPRLVIWHGQRHYRGKSYVDLDEEATRELKALGYIQ
jgi:hypothetical protein